MKGSWIILAIVFAVAGPASAQHEPPSHDDRSSGDDRSSSGDTGHDDPGDHGSPADSPSSGGDSGHQDSREVSGSSDASPSSSDVSPSGDVSPSSWDRDADRGHQEDRHADGEDRSGTHGSAEHTHSSPGGEREHDTIGERTNDYTGEGSTPAASPDGDSVLSPPPGARPRDPDDPDHPPTDAQRRHPRPTRDAEDGVSGGSPPDSGYATDSLDDFDYGGRFGYPLDDFSNRSLRGGYLRLLVGPGRTSVYVDGHYVGSADEFDGTVQRLFVSPGHHEVTLVLDGCRAHSIDVYVSTDQEIDVRHGMECYGPRPE